jgi:uncharacterized protein involved in exopolysaccharide biosynthesis
MVQNSECQRSDPQQPAPYNSGQYPAGYYPPPYHQQKKGVDLRELLGIIWQGKRWIIAITFVFAIASVIYSLSLPDIYKAEATLAPTDEAQGQGFGQEIGGLASLAGISMGKQKVDKVTMAMETLKSRQFIKNFVEKHNILPELMAVKEWHQPSGKLILNKEIYDPDAQEWLRQVESSKGSKPSSWEYVEVFQDIMSLNEDTESGILRFSLEHESPVIVKRWLDWLIEDINNEMRRRDIEEAQRSIAYIEREQESVRLSSTQQVYSSLLEQQTQKIMLANVRPEYVFRIIDPAVIPEEKAKPKRVFIVIGAVFLGLFLSLFLLFILHVIRTND